MSWLTSAYQRRCDAWAPTCLFVPIALILDDDIGVRQHERIVDQNALRRVVRMHVLYHAGKEPVFGIEMMEELGRHGYDVGAGTLYPMLHQLEQAGFLTSYAEVVGGNSASTTGQPNREKPPWKTPR